MADPYKGLSPRGRALRWLKRHRGITEQPAGSNFDNREDGIRTAQRLCAGGGRWLDHAPWCGIWCYSAAHKGGVQKLSSRMASVALIEDDARARRGPFRGWTTDHRRVIRGDLVVLFGRGVHVETVREVRARTGLLITDGGNTSSGDSGSQSNGGGAFRRVRRLRDVHGFALMDYPDARPLVGSPAPRLTFHRFAALVYRPGDVGTPSDELLTPEMWARIKKKALPKGES